MSGNRNNGNNGDNDDLPPGPPGLFREPRRRDNSPPPSKPHLPESHRNDGDEGLEKKHPNP